ERAANRRRSSHLCGVKGKRACSDRAAGAGDARLTKTDRAAHSRHHLIRDGVRVRRPFGQHFVDITGLGENLIPPLPHRREKLPESREKLLLEITVASPAFLESRGHRRHFFRGGNARAKL